MRWTGVPAVRFTLRAVTIVSLAAAATVSPPVQAVVPLLLLGFQIYRLLPKRNRPLWAAIGPAADYFTFFLLVGYFGPVLGLWAVLPALPALGAVVVSLASLASLVPVLPAAGVGRWRLTGTAASLGIATLGVLTFAAVAGSALIAVACVTSLAFFGTFAWWTRKRVPRPPVAFEPLKLRSLAGTPVSVDVKARFEAGSIGRVVFSPLQDWVKVTDGGTGTSDHSGLTLHLSFSPPLSGPSRIGLAGIVSDILGIWTYAFDSTPVELQVVPRARYAAWFARQYVRGTRRGTLPLLSTAEIVQSNAVGQVGIEYYGSRLYQPGDTVRMIDWKHSIKLAQLISKEFSELRGEKALLLVNLVASDEEAADRLAYNIIAAGLTLAHDKVPAAIAAYDDREPRMITPVLTPEALVARALQLSQQVVISPSPVRYLASSVSVMGLVAAVSRLRHAGDGPARTLAEILEVELRSLRETARSSPATRALTKAFAEIGRWCNVVVISGRNHDAEAMAFSTFELGSRGLAVIEV